MIEKMLIAAFCFAFNLVGAQNKMNDSEKILEFTITPTFKYGDLYLEPLMSDKR